MGLNEKFFKTIADTPIVPSEHFNTVLWTGDGISGRAITVGFQPDMSWYKSKNNASDHNLSDSVRGAQKQIRPNRDIAEVSATDQITAFTSTGLTLGNGGDANGGSNQTYVAWNWKAPTSETNTDGTITSTIKKNVDAGFSIVKYTGTGATATIGHGLDSIVELLIVKGLETTNDWSVLHKDGANGNFLQLNGSSAQSGSGSIFGSPTARPTDSVFTIGNTGETGTSNKDYIAYCFHSVTGYQKVGSYDGTGVNPGNFVTTDFEPRFLLVKGLNNSDNWIIVDAARNTSNPRNKNLKPNSTTIEATEAGVSFEFSSTGFKSVGDGAGEGQANKVNITYIYLAIA